MAKLYANSVAGSNTSPYDTWAKGATAIQTLLTAYAAGDEIWVAHDHAESGAGADVTLTDSAAATALQRIPIYRVNRSTDVYSPTTGADVIQIDTSDGAYDIQHDMYGAHHGMSYKMGDDLRITTAGIASAEFTDCYLHLPSNTGRITIGSNAGDNVVRFKNSTLEWSDAAGGQVYNSGAFIVFEACVFKGSPHAVGFLGMSNSAPKSWDFIGCDFSDWPSGEVLINSSDAADCAWHCRVINCLMPASLNWTDGVWGNDMQILEVFNSDDAGNLYVSRKENLRGTLSEDTAAYHDSGYVDADGDTNISMKMEARAATTEPHAPLESLPILARIDSTGSKTFTVECVENFTTALTKREAWIEVYYLGSSTETNWSIADDRELVASGYTNPAAGTGLANWTGEPTGSRSVKLTATGTVNQAGLYMVKVFLGNYESGKVLHYDPLVTVT